MNRMEVFNELCILGIVYHFFMFFDFVPDEEMQYMCGWSILAVLFFQIFMNLLIMMSMTLKSLYLVIKKYYFRVKYYRKGKLNKFSDIFR